MPTLPITSVTALFAAFLILLLTAQVIRIRRRDGVVLGDNDDRGLTKAIRGQANATEQLPIALILMGLSEMQGGAPAALTVTAIILVIGRAMHATYFAIDGTHWRLRFYGMTLTLMAQALLVVILAITLLTQIR